jgi:hypothetical protein
MYVGEKQRGSQFDYTDQAILVMLTVKAVFHLTNRDLEGFVRSLFQMMKIYMPVPDHSTLSKCGKDLKVNGRCVCMASRRGELGANCISVQIQTMAKFKL